MSDILSLVAIVAVFTVMFGVIRICIRQVPNGEAICPTWRKMASTGTDTTRSRPATVPASGED